MFFIYIVMNKMIIDTKALRENVLQYKNKVNKICCVVKADAYGHGVENIIPFIEDISDYFAVAKVCEGVKLRSLTSRPILVLGAFEGVEIASAEANDLTLSVYSIDSLHNLISSKRKINVHIKVNTGMNRLGVNIEELSKIKTMVKNTNICITGIYSHIYDNDSKDIFLQQRRFDEAVSVMGNNLITHISASGGVEKLSNYTMARIGLGIYGYMGGKKVMSITSKVAQIHKLKQGEKVGYNGVFVASEECYVATIPLGYYDGVPLNLAGEKVKIKGKTYTVIGRVCMDMFMCLVDSSVKVGSEVKVFYDASNWAKVKNTHEWEVLTSIKRERLKVVIK